LVGSGYAWSFPPLLCAAFYLVLQLISAVISRANSEVEGGLVLTGVAMLIRYISILALIPAVQALNTFWAAEQPDRPMRTSLSAGAIVTVIIGGLLLLLILLGLIVDITGLA